MSAFFLCVSTPDTAAFTVLRVNGTWVEKYAGNGQTGSTGDGSQATSASLTAPTGLAVDASNNLYIAGGY